MRLRGARRADALAGLRCAAGRRRHALRVDHRRMDRRTPSARSLRLREGAHGVGRGGLRRDRRRRGRAGPRLRGGLDRRDGHERRHDRRGRAGRGAGDCRARPVLARASRRFARLRGGRGRAPDGRAARRGRRAARVRLVLASRNDNKLRELRAALPGWDVQLLDAAGEPVEDGATFFENARIKARHGRTHAAPDAWVAGEDSGIEVVALGGAPGVRSARWADDPVARLLGALEGEEDRRVRYVCELVVVGPEGEEVRATGTLEGSVATEPRGGEGFGYDPIFVPLGESRTVAELGNAWKTEHSHRAQAALSLADRLTVR